MERYGATATIGERVRYARQTRALTQRELAKLLDRDQTIISRVERDMVAQPRPSTIKAFAAALDVSVAWLATGHGAMLASGEGTMRDG